MEQVAHNHDVEFVFTWWPIDVWTPSIIKTFFLGYGINPFHTYLMDITFWYRAMWNGVFEYSPLGWILNVVPEVLWAIPDAFTLPIEMFQWFFVTTPAALWRYFFHSSDMETVGWLAICMGTILLSGGIIAGLLFWALDASGMLAAEGEGAAAAAPEAKA